MQTGLSLVEMAREITERAAQKRDFVIDTREINIETVGEQNKIVIDIPGQGYYSPDQHALGQIAEHAGIPKRYFDRMASEAPELLITNTRHWFDSEPSRRMVRTLGHTARAFLSDRYRRIEHEDVAQAILPVLMESPEETRIMACAVTDSRLYIKALFPNVRGEVTVGDEFQAGIVISNSETGQGAFRIDNFLYRLVCLNGAMVTKGLRSNHVGQRVIEGADYTVYSDEALQADDKALALKARDAVRSAMAGAQFEAQLEKVREAMDGPKIEKPVKAIEVLGKTIGLAQSEQESVLERLIRGGDYSRYGAANAVTNLANDLDDFDRIHTLEQMGGWLFTQISNTEWQKVALAA